MTTVRELISAGIQRDGVATIDSDGTAAVAAAMMTDSDIGCLVVTDSNGQVVGVLSERDIVRRILVAGIDPATALVRDFMTRPVATCLPGSSLEQVYELMVQFRSRHVVVVDGDVPVGMVSSRQLIGRMLADDLEMRNLAIFSLARLAESRDPETGGHLERVREYARILARQMGRNSRYRSVVDRAFIDLLYATCPLHDIGKVSIPDSVLLKADHLDEAEFEIMKTHAATGAETLELALKAYPKAGFLQMAQDIAGCHHERVDGTGYPRGLRGEAIPLSARIFAVVDVYDALVSERVYKKAFSHAVARSIIIQGAGTQFDVDIVGAFLRCEDEFAAILSPQGRSLQHRQGRIFDQYDISPRLNTDGIIF